MHKKLTGFRGAFSSEMLGSLKKNLYAHKKLTSFRAASSSEMLASSGIGFMSIDSAALSIILYIIHT
jgi:hypothetical protein